MQKSLKAAGIENVTELTAENGKLLVHADGFIYEIELSTSVLKETFLESVTCARLKALIESDGLLDEEAFAKLMEEVKNGSISAEEAKGINHQGRFLVTEIYQKRCKNCYLRRQFNTI